MGVRDAHARHAGRCHGARHARPCERRREGRRARAPQEPRLAAPPRAGRDLLGVAPDDGARDARAGSRSGDHSAERRLARTDAGGAGARRRLVVLRQGQGHGRQLQLTVRPARPPRSGPRGCPREGRGLDEGPAILGVVCERRRIVGLYDRQRRRHRQHDMRRNRERLDHGRAPRHARCAGYPRHRLLLWRRLVAEGARTRARLARQAVQRAREPGRWTDMALLLPLRSRTRRPVHRAAVHRAGRLVSRRRSRARGKPRPTLRRLPWRADRRSDRGHELRALVSRQGPPAGARREEPPRSGHRLESPRARHRAPRRARRDTVAEGLSRRPLLARGRFTGGDARRLPPGARALALGQECVRSRARRRAEAAALHR